MTSQQNHTPAWGVPVGVTGASANSPAETQVLPPAISPVTPQLPAGPTRNQVELRVTALHYAGKMIGERGATNPAVYKTDIFNAAKDVETYLLTGMTPTA